MKQHYFNTITGFIVLIFLLAGCGNLSQPSQAKLDSLYPPESTTIEYHSDWTTTHYPERIKEFRASPLNFGDIVFIGNSITEGGDDWSAKFGMQNVRNRGISGDVTDGVLKRLDEITFFKPKAVFILIGINDLFNLYHHHQVPSAEYVARNILKITEIIHEKSQKTRILVQTVLPVSDTNLMDNIIIVNKMIKTSQPQMNYEVIDLHAAFVNDEGLLKKELTYDGVHLNDAGYTLWVEIVKPVLIPTDESFISYHFLKI